MTRLFHVSDIHFGAEDRKALDWFAHCVRTEVPDAIIFTGDLTMRARAHEFEAAARWLASLDRPMTVEVGNHDLPYFDIVARMTRPYQRYLELEKLIERPLDIEGVAIVPLKTTARFQWRLNWSKGYVGTRGLKKTVRCIEEVPEGRLVFVAAHHPLVDAGTRSLARTRRGAEALDAVARAGAHAVLSGHVHDPFDVRHVAGGREIRLIGAGTLSVRTRASRPSFNEIRVEGRGFETIARLMD